ncbi:hypothetical protein MTR67_004062, partial [Solanum verrucosum]
MHLLITPTACEISGLVQTIAYIKLPTTFTYGTLDIYSRVASFFGERVIRAYAFWCFDDLLTSAGTWSSAEYSRPVSKCDTAVKAVCVRSCRVLHQSEARRLLVRLDLVPSRQVDTYIPTSGIRASLFSLVNTKKRKDPDGMAAPPNMEEGQSSIRPPRFN